MEIVKYLVSWFLSPLLAALFLQLIGWSLFLLLPKKRPISLTIIAFGCALLFVGSLPVLSYERNRAREFVYEPLDPGTLPSDRPLLISVLGTGFNPDEWLPANSRVSGSAHARFLEGVRIYRSRPDDARLVVSVANHRATFDEKRAFLDAMIELVAIDPADVLLLTTARSTDDEAKLVAEKREEGEVVVIATSAGHMPRAMEIFDSEGLEPVAAPCEFWYPREGSASDQAWKRWVPSAGGIGATSQLLYESVASLWQRVTG